MRDRFPAALLALAVLWGTAFADESPEARMQRRYPQPVKVGDLIGLPVLDDNQSTLGYVREVVRTPTGRIQLIVSYSPWFGWWGRPVAVPIDAVGIFGRNIAAIDMPRRDFAAAPTWSSKDARPIPSTDVIRIGLARH
jgi:PRC-barrel domain